MYLIYNALIVSIEQLFVYFDKVLSFVMFLYNRQYQSLLGNFLYWRRPLMIIEIEKQGETPLGPKWKKAENETFSGE